MKKGFNLVHIIASVVLTYLVSTFFFSVFDFNYSVITDTFDGVNATIQIAAYVVIFRLVYAQLAFLFTNNHPNDAK